MSARYEKFDPIFVSGCGLWSAILKIIHAAYAKPKLLKLSKQEQQNLMSRMGDDEDPNFIMNKVNSEPKSALLRRIDKGRVRARTESQKPANEFDNDSDDDKKGSVVEFIKKPKKHKRKK